jgi:hypothetical protein
MPQGKYEILHFLAMGNWGKECTPIFLYLTSLFRYHVDAWQRIHASLASIEEAIASGTPTEAGKTEDKLNKINTILLGEKGR